MQRPWILRLASKTISTNQGIALACMSLSTLAYLQHLTGERRRVLRQCLETFGAHHLSQVVRNVLQADLFQPGSLVEICQYQCVRCRLNVDVHAKALLTSANIQPIMKTPLVAYRYQQPRLNLLVLAEQRSLTIVASALSRNSPRHLIDAVPC